MQRRKFSREFKLEVVKLVRERGVIDMCPVNRAGTPDEVGTIGALLMGPDGAFITGSDFLMDGGVTASFFQGELAPQ